MKIIKDMIEDKIDEIESYQEEIESLNNMIDSREVKLTKSNEELDFLLKSFEEKAGCEFKRGCLTLAKKDIETMRIRYDNLFLTIK